MERGRFLSLSQLVDNHCVISVPYPVSSCDTARYR
jgi:hypothetical protein